MLFLSFQEKTMRSNFTREIIAALSLIWAAAATAQDNRPVKIGEINSYSAAPEFAVPYRKGWQLAVEEINAAGGVDGRMIEVISRDDADDRNEAAQAAQELVTRDKVDVLAGTYLSNTGLAVSAVAAKNKKLFVAAGPLSDALTLDKGNRYTFRLRASTYMQAAMLAEEAARLPARRWAMLAPNYEYGQSAVANFKSMLKAKRPDIEFVAEQWPALGKMNAAAVVQRLENAKPDAIFNATFGADLAKFMDEGKQRGLFEKTVVASMLGGEPENLRVLKGAAPKGWIVTGYPINRIDTPAHARFVDAYFSKYNEYPHQGSIVGYTMIKAIAEGVRKARSTDSEKLVAAMRGLEFATPMGRAAFRAIDQQLTLGTYVGTLDLKDGTGFMTNWRYADGRQYLPDEVYVRRRRPASAIK
jgi:branched-chain amino acid transport system substrate-binding protein